LYIIPLSFVYPITYEAVLGRDNDG